MRTKISVVLIILFMALSALLIWKWGFCRFYVETNEMAVIISKSGKPLLPGQILAKEGQKGIKKDVLGEGRHFLNPFFYSKEILPVTIIPAGKVGVVTAKVGENLPSGEFLAEPNQKGIWRKVLGPGKYRLNPYGYKIEIIDAISIPVGYAGIITSLSGSQAEPGKFAEKNQKGVKKDILQPGLYYVNPKAFKIDILEIGVNQVSLLGKYGGSGVVTKRNIASQNAAMSELQDKLLKKQRKKRVNYLYRKIKSLKGSKKDDSAAIASMSRLRLGGELKGDYDSISTLGLSQFVEFPSRDGFHIQLDMTVEIELLPDKISWIFSNYGDLPAVIDKIIMPQITSISRNKGSEYRAEDFIMGEGREKFQNELTRALADTLAKKNIIVHNALIRHVEVPSQILDPIQQASISVEQNLTNKEKQNTARKLAELNTELAMIDQSRLKVFEKTEKIKAEIKADQEKQVAQINTEAIEKVAEINKETAAIKADIVRTLAQANAESLKKVEGEKASGLQLKAEAFDDPVAFSLWEFANKLNKDIKINILHAGDGTLWTDMEKARMGDMGGALLINQKQWGQKK